MLKSISKYNFRATYSLQAPELLRGKPIERGKVFIFQEGTTVPLETFSDFNAETLNTSPIYLTENGEANIYYNHNEKITVSIKDSNDEPIETYNM